MCPNNYGKITSICLQKKKKKGLDSKYTQFCYEINYSYPIMGMNNLQDTHTHTHTHTNTNTHTIPTITDQHTAAVLKTKSQLCDGIQCRLTARTGGSAKGETLDVQLGKE